MNPDDLPNGTPEQVFASKILAMTELEFMEWTDRCTIDEIERATKIIHQANLQLTEQMQCMEEEVEYEIEERLHEDSTIEYFPEAQEILSKFTLTGLK